MTVEVDLSEVWDVNENLAEGLAVSVNGHFETQDNPETAHAGCSKHTPYGQEVAGGSGPLIGPPPPA